MRAGRRAEGDLAIKLPRRRVDVVAGRVGGVVGSDDAARLAGNLGRCIRPRRRRKPAAGDVIGGAPDFFAADSNDFLHGSGFEQVADLSVM